MTGTVVRATRAHQALRLVHGRRRASTSRSRRTASTGFSGATAPARPRSCRCSPARTSRTAASSRCSAARRPSTPTCCVACASSRSRSAIPTASTRRTCCKAAPWFFENWDAEFAERLVADFRLPLNRYIKKLSRGQLSAVGVIVGLASRAELTFFDEPYLGLDAVARQIFYDRLLEDYAEHPRTIVLSTHLIDEVANLLEHVILIDQGRILLDRDADEVRGSATTVAGARAAVESFVADRPVIGREGLGGLASVTIDGRLDQADRVRAAELGLELAPVSLQQLIIHMTGTDLTADSTEQGGRSMTAVIDQPIARTEAAVAGPRDLAHRAPARREPLGLLRHPVDHPRRRLGGQRASSRSSSRAPAGAADDLEGMRYSWAVLSPQWYLVAVGVQAIGLTFSFALGFGATRRDFWLGTSVMFVLVAVMFAVSIATLVQTRDRDERLVGRHRTCSTRSGTGRTAGSSTSTRRSRCSSWCSSSARASRPCSCGGACAA